QPLTTPPTANVKPAIPTPAIPTAETQAANQHVGKWVRPPQYPSEMFAQGVTQTDGQPQALPAPIQQHTLHPEFQQLKAELAALKNRLNQVNQYLAALKTVNQQLNEEKKRLSQQFAQQQYEAQKTAKQIDDNNSREQARLHEQLASTKAALSTEQQKTRGFDEENAALRKQLAEAQQALAGLSTQQSQAQTNKSDLEAQVAALIQEKQQAAQDKATTDQQVAVLIQEKEQAAQDRTTIERQLAELTQEKEQATQDHDTAEQQLIQTNELLIEQQNSYQKLQTQSEALVQEKAENREQISRLQQALLVANQQAESENQQQYALAQQYDTIKSLLAQSALALAACQTNQERDSEARQRSFAAQHTLEQPLADYDQQNPLLNTSNALLQQENNQDQQRVEALAQAPLTPMPDGDEHDHDVAIDSKDQCSNTPESTAVGMSDCNADHDQDGVSDSQDQCPNTLADVRVNEQGCEPDQDGDGIVNRLDDCPLSAPFAEVNERGCLPDRDGDGVIDVRDQCPDSPKNSGVDAKGCVLDSDQDGIMDADDHCPSSPQDSFVNDQGCPFDDKEANRADGDDDNQKPQEATDNTGNISNNTRKVDLIEGDEGGNQAHQTTSSKSDTALSGGKNDDELAGNQTIAEVTENILETDDLPDADQDGVPDSSDLCSDSKVSEETRIDQLGCEKGMAINLEGVNFEKGSATLTAVSLPILDQALQILKNVPDITLEVGGHTDSKGNEQSNLQLSQRRAESVQHYFLDQGLSANHLVAKGYGETQAIADNNTAEGRAKNRRVELKVLD
ncbi:MAG TPA: hypothetical protein ENK78_02920, partial [Thiothrix sp.]|nr:hypothetical protein [Thiothrix sp.]